jgi:hypothetical protein
MFYCIKDLTSLSSALRPVHYILIKELVQDIYYKTQK